MSDWLPAGIDPFSGLTAWTIAGVVAAHAFGCFIRGAFGFGSNVPIVIGTTFLLGPHHAILLALLTTFVAQLNLIPQGVRTADWQVARPLILGLIAGTAFGTWLFTAISADWLVLVLGVLLTVILLMDTFHVVQRLSAWIDLRSKRLAAGFSLISGTVGGLSGAGAFYFLVVYMKQACGTAQALRGTNVVLSLVVMSMRMTVVIAAGLITPSLIAEAMLLTPVVFAAAWYGAHVFHTSTPERFYAALQVLLFAGALALVLRGIARIV